MRIRSRDLERPFCAKKNLNYLFFIFIGAPVEYFGLLKKELVVIPFFFFFFVFLLSIISGLQKQFPCNLQVMSLVQCIHSNDVIIPNSSIQCLVVR